VHTKNASPLPSTSTHLETQHAGLVASSRARTYNLVSAHPAVENGGRLPWDSAYRPGDLPGIDTTYLSA